MCTKVAILAEKEELQDCFSDYTTLTDFEPINEGLPLQKYPIFTENGFKQLVWGEKKEKLIIHKSKNELDFDNTVRGVLAVTGFYILKKEKAPAPIGFGDHKETVKITPYFVKRKDDGLILLQVAIDEGDNSFLIVMQKSSDFIENYQDKEPIVISNTEDWFKQLNIEDSPISDNDFEIPLIN